MTKQGRWPVAISEHQKYDLGDEALEDVEANGYNLEQEMVVLNDTIPAGQYAAGDVHCGEHDDHDH